MYIRDKNIMGEFEFFSSSSANKHYKGSETSTELGLVRSSFTIISDTKIQLPPSNNNKETMTKSKAWIKRMDFIKFLFLLLVL
jgi:hypothetical protein